MFHNSPFTNISLVEIFYLSDEDMYASVCDTGSRVGEKKSLLKDFCVLQTGLLHYQRIPKWRKVSSVVEIKKRLYTVRNLIIQKDSDAVRKGLVWLFHTNSLYEIIPFSPADSSCLLYKNLEFINSSVKEYSATLSRLVRESRVKCDRTGPSLLIRSLLRWGVWVPRVLSLIHSRWWPDVVSVNERYPKEG